MRLRSLLAAAATSLAALSPTPAGAQPVAPNATYANPLDLDYRFMADTATPWRQAADPVVITHGGEYWLFATNAGGYWRSADMRAWRRVVPDGLPLAQPAPALLALGGRLYYTAHRLKALYATDDPAGGRWRKVADLPELADPAWLLDDDGRLYLYHGSALNGGISVVELDPARDFRVVAGPTRLFAANHADHGWERSGPDNRGATMTEGFRVAPYVEGAWVTKHAGTYYLQYAAPGTVWTTYADGVYTAPSPTGPFTYQPYSPFSYRLAGFVGGAGHSSMFRDLGGAWWRVTTMIVSVRHKFERRLGIFPAGFDSAGVIRADAYLGDYPTRLPGTVVASAPIDSARVGWMLLSGFRAAAASSSRDGSRPAAAFDEDIRTTWSARTGGAGEWLAVDLGGRPTIRAVQVNFGDEGVRRDTATARRWTLEVSDDGRAWRTLVDRSRATDDRPHPYVQLDAPVRARHVRVTNVAAAAGGPFSVRDLRVFGVADVPPPRAVAGLRAARDPADARSATLTWPAAAGADGYVVRYGTAPDRLYASVQVSRGTSLTLHALNRGVAYWFVVDAFNGRGVTRGAEARELR